MKGESGYRGLKPQREWISDWVSNNDDLVRCMPIYVGGFSLLAVLFNRIVSGIAPVADAGRLCTLFFEKINISYTKFETSKSLSQHLVKQIQILYNSGPGGLGKHPGSPLDPPLATPLIK